MPENLGLELEGTAEDQGSLEDRSLSPDQGNEGSGGTSAEAPEKFRSLAELNDLASSNRNMKMSDTEKKRVEVAVKRGITSDDEITDILKNAEDAAKNSGKSDGGPEKASGDDNTDDKKGNAEEDEKTDNNKQDDSGKDSDEDSGDVEIDSQLLNAIGPHLQKAESVDDAVQAIKDLEHRANRGGEFVNRAKKLGVNTVEELEKSIDTLNNIDSEIATRLKSPEGLKGLYEAFKIPVPTWMSNVAQADSAQPTNNNAQSSELPPELNQYLTDIEEDGFIGVKQFKELVPALTTHIQKNLEAQNEEKFKKLDSIGGFVNKMAKQTAAQAAASESFQDAREISSKFSKFDESLKLSEDPSIIWKESVTPDNKVKRKAHPEWPTLQKVLSLRLGAIKSQASELKKMGVTSPVKPDPMAYLAKTFITTGQLGKMQEKAGKDAKSNLVNQLANKLQPKLHGKARTPSDGFKTPKTSSDVKHMTKPQRAAFFAKLKRGELRVGA